MLSSDIGSMPAKISSEIIWSGAGKSKSLLPLLGVGNDDMNTSKMNWSQSSSIS